MKCQGLISRTCINEEHFDEEYLQFRIPASTPDHFPNHFSIDGKNFRIDHALPYATPILPGVRPPCAQTVHEHWKLSVHQTATERKGHVNVIERVEKCLGSNQRLLKLREVSFHTSSGYFEKSQVPLCFFRKEVSIDLAVEKFTHWCQSFKALDENILAALERYSSEDTSTGSWEDHMRLCIATVHCKDEQSLKIGMFVKGRYGWTVSTSEHLQCYAYTNCTLVLVVPAGCRIEEICSPARHVSIRKMFPLCGGHNSERQPDDARSSDSVSMPATPLGSNPLNLPPSAAPTEDLRNSLVKNITQDQEISATLAWSNKAHEAEQDDKPGHTDNKSDPLTSVMLKCDHHEGSDDHSRYKDGRFASQNHQDVGLECQKTSKGQAIRAKSHPPTDDSHIGRAPPAMNQQGSQPDCANAGISQQFQNDSQGAAYAEGGQIPNVVTTARCTAEAIPDPQSNDEESLRPIRDLKPKADDQNVLPPLSTYPKTGLRDRKSRSVSVSKRCNVSVGLDQHHLPEVFLPLSPNFIMEVPRLSCRVVCRCQVRSRRSVLPEISTHSKLMLASQLHFLCPLTWKCPLENKSGAR